MGRQEDGPDEGLSYSRLSSFEYIHLTELCQRPVAERATPVVGITPMEAQRLKKKWKSEQSYAWMGTVVKVVPCLSN